MTKIIKSTTQPTARDGDSWVVLYQFDMLEGWWRFNEGHELIEHRCWAAGEILGQSMESAEFLIPADDYTKAWARLHPKNNAEQLLALNYATMRLRMNLMTECWTVVASSCRTPQAQA